jgi:signal transduction histidine kinase
MMRWYNPLTWFPWSQDGRRTSLYLSALFAAPVLTAVGIWIMHEAKLIGRFEVFDNVAYSFAASLFLVVAAIAVGTGLNIKLSWGKDGLNGAAGGSPEAAALAARETADAAGDKATEIERDAETERRRLAQEQGDS